MFPPGGQQTAIQQLEAHHKQNGHGAQGSQGKRPGMDTSVPHGAVRPSEIQAAEDAEQQQPAGSSKEQQQEPHCSREKRQQAAEKLLAAAPGSMPVSNLGEVTHEWQLLRMECINEKETRRLIGSLDVVLRLCSAAFIVLLVYKVIITESPSNYFCQQSSNIVNATIGALCTLTAVAAAAYVGRRVQRSLVVGKKWSPRRRRLLVIYMCQLGTALLGMLCYCASSALVISSADCSRSEVSNALIWLSFIRWSSLNCFFLLLTVQAHDACILQPHAVNAPTLELLRMSLGLPRFTRQPGQWLPRFQFGDTQTSTGMPGYGKHKVDVHRASQQQQQQQQKRDQSVQEKQDAQAANSSSGSRGAGGSTAAPAPAGDIEMGVKDQGPASSLPTLPGEPEQEQQQQVEGPQIQHPQNGHNSSHWNTTSSRQQRPHGVPVDAMVLDLPVWYHWPLLLPWLLLEGCLVATALLTERQNHGGCRPFLPSCELRPCQPLSPVIGVLSGQLALVLLYYVLWLGLMYRCRSLLRARPWQEYRTANSLFRMQRRLGIWAYTLIVLSLVVFWFISFGSCSRYSFQYYGLPPVEVMWCAVAVISVGLIMPNDPKALHPLLITQLQEFAWTEGTLQQRIQERDAATFGLSKGQPMFCFETGVKLFYWSCFVYDYQEEVPLYTSPVKEDQLEQLMKAMAMYSLEVHKEVYDPESEVKALFAWSNDTIVITFRGSYARANWIADAMVWRSAAPTSDKGPGQAGKVHSGFLRCWYETGMDKRVLGMAKILIEGAFDLSRLKIYLTGHSLGGALATLAAFDIVANHPQLRPDQISVYTYGAPRAGNHRFARTYMRAVPDTWHIIHDQDMVPRGGKFLSLYKRNGQRVIINRTGDLVVRPGPLESSLLQLPMGSNPMHHLLAAYQASLTAIALAQLDSQKQLPGGTEGLLALVQDCPIMVESMYQYGNVRNLVTWLGNRAWFTLRSRAPRPLGGGSSAAAAMAATPGATPRDQQQDGRRAKAAARAAQRRERRQQQQQRRRRGRQGRLGHASGAANGAAAGGDLEAPAQQDQGVASDTAEEQQQEGGGLQPAHSLLTGPNHAHPGAGDIELGLAVPPTSVRGMDPATIGTSSGVTSSLGDQAHRCPPAALASAAAGQAGDLVPSPSWAAQELQPLADAQASGHPSELVLQAPIGLSAGVAGVAAEAGSTLQQVPNNLLSAASAALHWVVDAFSGGSSSSIAAGDTGAPEGPVTDMPPVHVTGATPGDTAAGSSSRGVEWETGTAEPGGSRRADAVSTTSSSSGARGAPTSASSVATSSSSMASPFAAAAAAAGYANPPGNQVSFSSSSAGAGRYTSPFAVGPTGQQAATLAEQRLQQHHADLASQLDEAATLRPGVADFADAAAAAGLSSSSSVVHTAAGVVADLPAGVPAPRLSPSLLTDLELLGDEVAAQDLETVRSLTLMPAQSAPHAMINPAALESVSAAAQEEGGVLEAAAEKFAEGAQKLSESTERVKHKVRRRARRALHKMGLASIDEASSEASEAEGMTSTSRHAVGSSAASDVASLGSSAAAASVATAGSASGSTTGSTAFGSATSSVTASSSRRSGSSSRSSKPAMDMSALEDRHVISLNVRRLSLPSPAHVASNAPVMSTAVHAPRMSEAG